MSWHHRLSRVLYLSAIIAFTLAGMTVVGCGGDGKKRVYKTTGQILVDDKPAKKAFVYFHPIDTDDPKLVRPFAQADDNGNFAASTYISGDGLPEGEYILTFEWREPSGLFKQDWDGRDKLGSLYADPKKSAFRLKVEKKPSELQPYNLYSKKNKN